MPEAVGYISRVCSEDSEPVHLWFSLSYANYLVLPRSVLQSMSEEWQRRFVACLEELDAAAGHLDWPSYAVNARGSDGRFVTDPIPLYNRGRARVPLREIRELPGAPVPTG
jgi:hypothetical protein